MRFFTVEEMSKSRIFFEQEPNQFSRWFSILVAIILCGFMVIIMMVDKVYIVKAQGTVNALDKQYVTAGLSGVVVDIFVEEGAIIEKGQPLFKVADGQGETQWLALRHQLEQALEKIEIMNRYQASLENGINDMKNEGLEQEYYGYIEYYLAQIKSESYSRSINQKQFDILLENKQEVETELEQLYEIQGNEISDSGLEDTDQIKEAILNKEAELTSIHSEMEALSEQLNSPISQASQFYAQLLMELGKSRTAIETQIVELQGSISVYSKQIQGLDVVANQRGIVHYFTAITVGMSLQQYQIIAEINDPSTSQEIVVAYVAAQDITKIKLNDQVKVAVIGVNETKYGVLEGRLTHIDVGTTSQETSAGVSLYYRVEVSLEDIELSHQDSKLVLETSWPVEIRIIYQNESYFEWILELLNFKN